ncbi:LysR substrate-binding domain-containing protein [Pelomonas sp. KK5]|uniref:LysR substrate-binding domain-containing protein n=1 Tax=Pelomonas sp. KK5 TaxID=1855730 RepID=UPI00097BF374|nr:LysR substrate-binding domain-containing protein [Pelomonas sp. KK5]
MTIKTDFDKIELQLVRVLHTVISEHSVSKAALKLHSTQPAVSAQLKRLRALTGDPLLVRSGSGMVATAAALELMEPAARMLQDADLLFGKRHRKAAFEPSSSELKIRIAASDYLDPYFLPDLVVHLNTLAPGIQLDLQPLNAQLDYRRGLARGELDLVIGNWLQPPSELHLGRLLSDEVVCLMSRDHPLAKEAQKGGRGWSVDKYLGCQHLAPMPLSPGMPGVIDQHLATLGLDRAIAVRSAHFGQLPQMVGRSLLVLTTGRLFCQRYVDELPVVIVRCPVAFPRMSYYQLWHAQTNASPALRWLREQVREVAARISSSSSVKAKS